VTALELQLSRCSFGHGVSRRNTKISLWIIGIPRDIDLPKYSFNPPPTIPRFRARSFRYVLFCRPARRKPLLVLASMSSSSTSSCPPAQPLFSAANLGAAPCAPSWNLDSLLLPRIQTIRLHHDNRFLARLFSFRAASPWAISSSTAPTSLHSDSCMPSSRTRVHHSNNPLTPPGHIAADFNPHATLSTTRLRHLPWRCEDDHAASFQIEHEGYSPVPIPDAEGIRRTRNPCATTRNRRNIASLHPPQPEALSIHPRLVPDSFLNTSHARCLANAPSDPDQPARDQHHDTITPTYPTTPDSPLIRPP
jgi:hypothetical protein